MHPPQGALLLGSGTLSSPLPSADWAVGGFPARSMVRLLAVSLVEVAQAD